MTDIIDFMKDFQYETDKVLDEALKEKYKEEFREQIRLAIKAFEIIYEELGKANLPVETKQAIMENLIKNFKENK